MPQPRKEVLMTSDEQRMEEARIRREAEENSAEVQALIVLAEAQRKIQEEQ